MTLEEDFEAYMRRIGAPSKEGIVVLKLIHEDGREIKSGDIVNDFRGDPLKVDSFRAGKIPGVGKITAMPVDASGKSTGPWREYNSTVIKCSVVEG